MARGWESKSVEAQQEEASRPGTKRRAATTPEELAVEERRQALELMRKRAVDDLSRAVVPAHRHMLEQAIASLDTDLARLRVRTEGAGGWSGDPRAPNPEPRVP
jgi:hypothetical protein